GRGAASRRAVDAGAQRPCLLRPAVPPAAWPEALSFQRREPRAYRAAHAAGPALGRRRDLSESAGSMALSGDGDGPPFTSPVGVVPGSGADSGSDPQGFGCRAARSGAAAGYDVP